MPEIAQFSKEIHPDVSVVIPSFNRCESMFRLLNDIVRQEEVSFEVIVVDDKSKDNTVDMIGMEFPSVKVLVNDANCGPAVSRNRGINEAASPLIVGIDSDVTVPDPLCLKKVLETFRELPQATCLAFRLFQPDGKSEDFARWWHPVSIKDFGAKRFETDYFSGTGCAFRKESLIKAGLYPEILYMHYEEYELAYRLMDNGGSIIYCPNISVVHHESQISRRSEIKTFYKHRNQILIAVAMFPWPKAFKYLVPRTIATFLTSIRYGFTKSYLKSIASAWKLSKIRIKNRKPLSKQTFIKIKRLKKGVAI